MGRRRAKEPGETSAEALLATVARQDAESERVAGVFEAAQTAVVDELANVTIEQAIGGPLPAYARKFTPGQLVNISSQAPVTTEQPPPDHLHYTGETMELGDNQIARLEDALALQPFLRLHHGSPAVASDVFGDYQRVKTIGPGHDAAEYARLCACRLAG